MLKYFERWLATSARMQTEEDRQLARILFALVLIGGAALACLNLIAAYWQQSTIVMLTLISGGLLSVPLGLLWRGHSRASSIALTTLVLGIVTVYVLLQRGIYDVAMMMYPVIVLFAALALYKSSFMIFVLLCNGSIGAVAWTMFARDATLHVLTDGLVAMLVLTVASSIVYLLAENIRQNLARAHHEIAERKRIEAELRESEKKYRLLAENITDVIWVRDMETARLRYISPSVERLNGYTVEEALAQNWDDALTPDSFIATHAAWQDRIAEFHQGIRKTYTYEIELKHKNGSTVWAEAIARLVRDEDTGNLEAYGVLRNITRRKHVERELQRQRDFAMQVMNTMGQGLTVTDATGRIEFANPACARLLGYAPEELVGKNARDFFPAEEQARLTQILTDRQNGKSGAYEKQLRRADGSVMSVLTVSVPLWRDGQGSGSVAVITDLTERKQMEDQLRDSEKRYRLLAENISDVIWIVDWETSRLRYISPSVVHLRGYTAEEMLQVPWTETMPPESLALTQRVCAEAFEAFQRGQSPTYTYQVEQIHKNGARLWTEVAARVVRNEETGKLEVYGVSRNVTDRKHIEDQLRQLSRAVEASPASIIITDTTGTIEYVNPKFTQVTGYTLDEARGQNPRILQSGEMPSEAYKGLWDTLLAGKEWRGEFHNKKKNGELYWESASISPITDARGKITHFVAVKEDITARKQIEEQLRYLSTRDVLTGLHNRAFFEAELNRLAASREIPISIIAADVNDLKLINDTHGHAAGDELLRRAARILQSVFRASDILARLGGDEFALVLPKTDERAALDILARIRDNLRVFNAAHPDLPVSISLGTATAADGDLTRALRLADARMYADKRSYKNAD
jgi:diguanylate cyclase (GGDEF)-like protein/PAS domain S-box-containing protein